ncbi:MAG: hypothetical protein ACI9NC_001689, partial [Verrucomicrobiales bacterium]
RISRKSQPNRNTNSRLGFGRSSMFVTVLALPHFEQGLPARWLASPPPPGVSLSGDLYGSILLFSPTARDRSQGCIDAARQCRN